MSVPKYRLDAIETIGRKILQEYDPVLLDGPPQAVPIETIIETKFDLTLEYHCLRKNGSILGETIFDEGAAILYDQDEKRYRLIAVKAGTILVEERLCVDRLLGRLRFTCAHELGHWVLHQKLYSGTGDVAAYVELDERWLFDLAKDPEGRKPTVTWQSYNRSGVLYESYDEMFISLLPRKVENPELKCVLRDYFRIRSQKKKVAKSITVYQDAAERFGD